MALKNFPQICAESDRILPNTAFWLHFFVSGTFGLGRKQIASGSY